MRFWVLSAVLLCLPLWAGQIVLKNGDRLSGSLVKSDGKTLTFKSDLAGTVAIPWDAVVSISSSEPVSVGLSDGQVIVGSIDTVDHRLVIVTKDAGKVVANREAVRSIRSQEEQAAYDAEIERYRHPALTDLWTGFVDVGVALTQGNAKTSNLNVTANASRATSRDKMEVNFTSLYASNSINGVSQVTANAIRGGIRYSLNLTPKVLAFGSTDLEYDEFQKLDLRFSPAGGAGWIAVKNERSILELLGGLALNREFFSTGLNRTSGEALIGQEFTHKPSKSVGLNEKFTIYPNLSRGGEYRMNFDFSAVTTVRKWLGWQISISDRFLSDPLPGRKQNDILFTSGFRLTFARR
jgi:small nuclear ribonucleoprotein (snRNP)-like protein